MERTGRGGGDYRRVVKRKVEVDGEGGGGGVLQESDVVVRRVLSVVEHCHHAKPELQFRL